MTAKKEPFAIIIEKLVELKDTSELMVDLAYSSLLLNNQHLAEEVQALEEHMDKLHTEFEKLVLSSGFKPEDSQHFLGMIRLGVATEQIADAGNEIAEVVLRELQPHPILKLAIEEAEETVARVPVSSSSPLIGKTLRQAQIHEETGMWILAIKRGDVWLRPRHGTVIEENDILIASGYAEGEADFENLASPNE
ncbi:MAG: hypothetical protein JSV05_08270 [Candidatus Bathyarchaeota archaeon]|nr:MAG: hypothetical protein JSV05_08270 [Candidatus Bathyarchaeota archaeon]